MKQFLCLLILGIGSALADSVDVLIARADTLDEKNDNRAALALCLQADKLRANDPDILRRIAKHQCQLILDAKSTSEKKSLAAQSVAAAERALALDDRNAKVHLTAAIVYGRAAQLESPRRQVELSRRIRLHAEQATRLDPSDDYAWHVLGRWHYELANFNPFLKTLAQAVYGKFPDASNARAAECFQKAIALGTSRVIHHVEYGRTLAAMGRVAEARKQLEKGLSLPSKAKDDEETKARARAALQSLSSDA